MDYDVTKKNYEIANEWHEQKSLNYMWTSQLESFLALLDGGRGKKVLDAGCGGSGRDIEQFRKHEVVVEGLDYSHAAIESLRKKFPSGTFYEADLTKTDLRDVQYDGVWACASILNLTKADAHSALSEFKRVLKPNGVLFVSVKEGEGERMLPDKSGERFFNFYSKDEIQSAVKKAGFETDHIEVMDDTFNQSSSGATLPRWISIYAKKI